jgi:hypothetical protein
MGLANIKYSFEFMYQIYSLNGSNMESNFMTSWYHYYQNPFHYYFLLLFIIHANSWKYQDNCPNENNKRNYEKDSGSKWYQDAAEE